MGSDATAAEDFCAALHPRILGMLTLLVGDADVAQDLTQETLGRVWARWSEVREMSNPHAWAHQVALNLARSRWRRVAAERRARSRMEGMAAAPAEGADVADVLAVRTAVSALPRRQRTTLVLRYWSDLSVEETAQLLQCSPGTVKSQTAAAIRRLRRSGLFVPERTAHG